MYAADPTGRASTEPPTLSGDMSKRRLGASIPILICGLSIVAMILFRPSLRSKEIGLKTGLSTLRTVIDEYTHDKRKPPQRLIDLVNAGYLRQLPVDPMTGRSDSWRVVMEDAFTAVNQTEPGVFDVRSGSDAKSVDGTAYAEW
jgi:general secretion pathway protein G